MSGELTPRQEADLNVTVRHLGRAMRSMARAGVALPASGASAVEWSLYRAEVALSKASDHLIDALEADAAEQSTTDPLESRP